MQRSDISPRDPRESQSPPPPSNSRDPLSMRIYFKAHLTDMVRAFRYERVTVDEARARLKLLNEQYGEKVIKDAAEELLVVENTPAGNMARLTDEVRRLAVGLLGKPPENGAAQIPSTDQRPNNHDSETDDLDEEADLEDDEQTADVTEDTNGDDCVAHAQLIPHDAPQAQGKPVRLPRQDVVFDFGTWVATTRQTANVLSAERLKSLSPQTRTFPDYLLTSDQVPTLICVRQKLSKMQHHDLSEWQKVFGTNHLVLRVWPVKRQNGWVWTAEVIVSAEEDPRDGAMAEELPEPVQSPADESTPNTAFNGEHPRDHSAVPRQPVTPILAPGKPADFSRFANRLELIEGELGGADILIRQAQEIQAQLRSDLDIWRDQLQRAMRDAGQ